ncbi:MAG: YdcF family protein [Alphaproteobacteria bacterium]|nr:YdcF family protein [Alphaproteobacteria bacterium]
MASDPMRLLWDVFQPSNSLLILALLGALLRLLGKRRAGTWLAGIAAVGLAVILATPLPDIMLVSLETRFPQPALPRHIDGIVSLGGAVNTRLTDRWHAPQLNDHVERLTEAIGLWRRHPEATLVLSGGHWDPHDRLSEGDVARMLFKELGEPMDRVVVEDRSRTTWENGVFSKALVHPKPGQTWVLVTSAYHMPRAVGVFRRLGWQVIPYPVDYYTEGKVTAGFFNSVGYRLAAFDFVTREWAGVIGYYLRGRSAAPFPGPAGG